MSALLCHAYCAETKNQVQPLLGLTVQHITALRNVSHLLHGSITQDYLE